MNIEELQAAIADYERPALAEWMKEHEMLSLILEAARLVADAERAMVVASMWIEGERQWVMVLENDVDAAEGAPFYLAAAVLTPGDTLKSLTTRTAGNPDSHFTPGDTK